MHPLGYCAAPIDALHQQLDSLVAHLEQRNLHAAESGLPHRAFRPVVEADDGDIVWHAAARFLQRLDGAQGGLVIAGQHSAKRRA